MKCKFCDAELEEGVTLCPVCGKENGEAAEETETAETPETEEKEEIKETTTPEGPKLISFTPGKLTLVIGSVVLLTALLVALIMQGMGYSFSSGGADETTAPTTGNVNDVTFKSNYTVSDEEAIAARDDVVATVGNAQLTNGELQIYYWLEVQEFLGTYGMYASYYGLDYTQPLDTQSCTMSETAMTWQQYFLENALATWHTYQALAEESLALGIELDSEHQGYLDGLEESMATEGGLQGFESAEAYLAYNVGPGSSVDHYRDYMETYYQGFLYFRSRYEAMTPTEEEMDAYFAENEATYTANGITKDTVYVDVRHILVLPEGATVATIYSETFPDEAWAVAEQTAQSILDSWLEGEATEESFAALANQHSADTGSNTNGGLYEDVYVGMMVEEFEAWCFDAARQVGDYGIVKTDLGYHIMYFSGSTLIWKEYVMEAMLGERGAELISQMTEKYPIEVNYEAIKLGLVNPASWLS